MTTKAAESPLNRLLSFVEHPAVRGGIPILITAIAIFVLHRLSREVNLAEVRADFFAADADRLMLAVLFTCISFAGLALYDVVAAWALKPGLVPLRIAALAGAAGYALSNLLGFSYLTGTALRYRIYSAFDIDFATVVNLVAFTWSAFWLGLTLIVGALFVLHPDGLSAVLNISGQFESVVGAGLLASLAGFFLYLAGGSRRLNLLGHHFILPSFRQAGALTGAAVLDLGGASLVLYTLMPADLAGNFSFFFIIFVISVALGIFSHTPGGLGVFEVTLLAGLGAGGRSDAIAALLLYRVIYTALPFSVAVTGLALAAIIQRRGKTSSFTATTRMITQPIVPAISAGIAMSAGAVLLLSGNLPAVGSRLDVLRGVVPLGIVETSHLLGSVLGVLLLVIAQGLYRRLWNAWLLAIGFLSAGLAASLAKGLDLEEALLLAAGIGVLTLFRGSFHRVKSSNPLQIGFAWFASVLVLIALITWIGLFAYKHVEYRDALWWEFTWSGDASRFLRANLATAVVLAALALHSLIFKRAPRHKPEPVPPVIRDIIAKSESSEANIALLGDKSFLIDPDGRAYLAYGDTGSALVTQGEPIGNDEAAIELLWQFRELADQEGKRFVYFALSSKFVPTFLDMGLAVVKYGEVARVDLTRFTLDGPSMKDFRYAHNRAARDGFSFEIVPAADVPDVIDRLRQISDAWLTKKSGVEKAFTLGRFDDGYLSNFDIAVLRAPGEQREIVAFANVLKGADVELSIDLMRSEPGSPNFAMDALFSELILWGKAQGFRYFNLGAAPFSGSETHVLASRWQRLSGFLFEHGNEFYHFEGLRSFKEKFGPDWSPNYVACQGGLGVARALLDANELISGGFAGLVRKGT